MSLLNNFSSSSINTSSINTTILNNLSSKRFGDQTALNDIVDLLSKGSSKGLNEEEFSDLLDLLKMFNIELDFEDGTKEIEPGKFPSILSSTEAYIKVMKAIIEVLEKLKEEEERNLKKIRMEAQAALYEEKIAQIQKDMEKASKIIKDKLMVVDWETQENFDEIEKFLEYIREEYNIDLQNPRSNPVNINIVI